MRLNEDTVLIGARVVLVPYEVHHVDKYHKWMGDPGLQLLTGSEPLSLEQEYDMQRKWRDDVDKCTFIVLDRVALEADRADEVSAMVGDVNLFAIQADDGNLAADDEGDNEQQQQTQSCEEGDRTPRSKSPLWQAAECEIMIAEEAARGKGFGKEAMLLMMKYAAENFCPRMFVAKIKIGNVVSQAMFDKIGFVKQSASEIFQEVTMMARSEKLTVHFRSVTAKSCKYSAWRQRQATVEANT